MSEEIGIKKCKICGQSHTRGNFYSDSSKKCKTCSNEGASKIDYVHEPHKINRPHHHDSFGGFY